MANYKVIDSVGVIEVDNPPVNALSFRTRKGILDGLEKALSDKNVASIILIGKGSSFPAGADISEFSRGLFFSSPTVSLGAVAYPSPYTDQASKLADAVLLFLHWSNGTIYPIALDHKSFHVRKGIQDGLQKARGDSSVKTIVLIGKNKTFPSGADISEFASGKQRLAPTITDLTHALENSKKPVIAAVHGTALGGGCELTISTHYRVADKKARFGFPEVDIGILPAATGTQRFPRLVGMEAALKYIPTGQHFSAKEAQKIGMVDKIAEKNLLDEAVAFAKSVAGKPFEYRRTSRKAVPDADKARNLAQVALQKAATKYRGLLAPVFCIKSVLAAVEFPFERGLEKEMEYASVLFMSGQARALQYAFFAQRASTKWSLPDGTNFKTIKPKELKTAAVIGAGTMGTGIAMTLLNAGIPVILVEQDEKFLKKGVAAVKNLYEGSVKLGKLTAQQAKMILSQLKPSLNYQDLKNVDFVIEAVFEDLAIKQEVFKKLDAVCKPEALLCTNTSYISIDKIASATARPDKVIGTHFFVPAYYMKLLENVRGAKTSPDTIGAAMALGSRIGKVPVLVGNCNGFVGNRMLSKLSTEAVFLVEEGATPSFIDQTLEDFGMTLGTFKVSDLSGLDIGWRTRKAAAKAVGKELEHKRFSNGVRTSYLADIVCEQGRFGRKTGKGWYRYEAPGAKEAFVDPAVERLIVQYSQDNGIERRQISTQEIIERCFYVTINEGFKILEEGIASKPEDVDTIWLLGYGFPRQMGGPMFYANQVGIPKVYERICHYYKERPCCPQWQPSDLMRKIAETNAPMQGWMKHRSSHL